MESSKKTDVVVVGAGPAGCVAAKRCAESGLNTVLFEMRKLPRDKVCTGLISGSLAQRLIQDEFGEIPRHILADPYYYNGVRIYVLGAKPPKPLTVERKIPVGWRRDIDFWMTQKTKDAGVTVCDECVIKGVESERDCVKVKLSKRCEEFLVRSSYVIGADGVRSAVRRSVCPDLKVGYQQEIRECYDGSFPLDRTFLHAFYIPGKSWFDINHKGPHFCLEVSAKPGELKERIKRAKEILSREYGFDFQVQPVWRDACMEPRIHEQLIDGTFAPAKDRVLLAGDAAGFQLPTSEGIGTALLSGVMAAESIDHAVRKGGSAAGRYLKSVSVIINTIEKQLIMAKNSRYKETSRDLEEVAEGIRSLLEKSMFEDTFSGSA
jgi:flavin-dependent dehydrogenase